MPVAQCGGPGFRFDAEQDSSGPRVEGQQPSLHSCPALWILRCTLVLMCYCLRSQMCPTASGILQLPLLELKSGSYRGVDAGLCQPPRTLVFSASGSVLGRLHSSLHPMPWSRWAPFSAPPSVQWCFLFSLLCRHSTSHILGPLALGVHKRRVLY